MFDENQLVKIKWSNKTRKHYELLGYNFTEYGEEFYVKAKDLPFGCNAKVVVTCDYCGKESYVSYCNYLKRANKDIDSCNTCKTKKTREIRMRKKQMKNLIN